MCYNFLFFFFFKQKTAYEMSVSDWSSDVCSSDLDDLPIALVAGKATGITGNRYIRYPKGTPLANLHVTLLDKLGVRIEKFGDATGPLGKLSDQVLSNI